MVKCPLLLLRGVVSDVLPREVAHEVVRDGRSYKALFITAKVMPVGNGILKVEQRKDARPHE